ncbi:cytochrome P450 [Kutzneria sp. NPDC052558]|uniref:cytochrome P450 n=1 Tax=Kutzneria sp. NPDC052558 TaxID=3364121 RepID=UPI0037C88B05
MHLAESHATGVDISSRAFWAKDFHHRDESFARLRARAAVSWHPPMEVSYPHDERGFWAVTRAADISAVSREPELFSSRHGIAAEPLPRRHSAHSSFFLSMDPPEHGRYRALVNAAFTPKAVGRIAERIEADAAQIVDSLVGAGDIEFVADCASRLPLTTFSDIVGVPPSERARVAEAAHTLIGGGKAEGLPPESVLAAKMSEYQYLLAMGASMAEHRRRKPSDDLLTGLVQAEIDGARLTDREIGQFMTLISVAGTDTTKQTTTLTALALDQHPDQRDWLLADFDGRVMPAIEEFVRHATPVMTFARTATADTELHGAPIAAGDKVVLFYCSGNRDGAVFTDPEKFDLRRPRSRHVSFGGGGPHYCLGAGVARTQLRALFKQLLTRLPGIEFGTPVRLAGSFVNGIATLPARVG